VYDCSLINLYVCVVKNRFYTSIKVALLVKKNSDIIKLSTITANGVKSNIYTVSQ